MTAGEAIRAAAEALGSVSDTARLDAELLMAHLFGATRSELLLRHMRDPAPPGFPALVERRAGHEPVAYITGRQDFYGLTLIVTPATLIPRGDSETLVEAALAERPDAVRVVDLGTGSGALLLAVLAHCGESQGVGIDRSADAVAVAQRNAEALGLRRQARFLTRDWHASGWAEGLGTFDLVLCNPPYVEDSAALDRQVADFEPASALFAGPGGLDDYRVLIPQLRALMNCGGLAVLEIGANQAQSVGALAAAAGFRVALRRDLAGRARALLLT
ncbi:MAG: peptide chain release factor N(5)-glutamine methyltransferase [Erythrobacter sp.]|uniref:peptide chain release factor N(5)-glutamine methyltransferase n=1 Tax=Erythrobacter sp. TaxID=1042 RepID=UPI0025FDA68B|nr:peptide chain release factor N(5)-glutamine methyltransferase [Erythrobacter sp.]MCL9997816.1 peptide chain release factor N(5)-glutamine methyltransferase [Erythrobacter sp.]